MEKIRIIILFLIITLFFSAEQALAECNHIVNQWIPSTNYDDIHGGNCTLCGEYIAKACSGISETNHKCVVCGRIYHKKVSCQVTYKGKAVSTHLCQYKKCEERKKVEQCSHTNATIERYDYVTDSGSEVNGHRITCNLCSMSGSQSHFGGTHQNNGKCEACGYNYQQHKKDKMEYDEKEHWYTCGVSNCKEKFEKEIHSGGTHGDGAKGIKAGECTVCHAIYQSHIKDTSKFGSDAEYHWYGCKMENCDGIFKEEHKKGTKVEYDEDYHWYICANSDCNKTFGKERHYGGEDNNGICKGCKMDYMNEPSAIKIKKGSKGEDGYRELEEIGDNVKLQVEFTPKKTVFTDVEWISEDDEVASVDENGVVTGISDGNTVIRAKHGELEDSCQIFVGEGIFKIIADKEEMNEDDTCELTTNIKDKLMEINWRVSSEKLGELEEDEEDEDVMIFKSDSEAGGKTVTIYAETKSGIEAKIKLKIVHSGGTHGNSGVCQVCEESYQTHTLTDFKYVDETGHYKLCSYPECKGKKFSEEPHTSTTKCSLCGWKKPNSSGGTPGGSGGSGGSGGPGGSGGSTSDEWEWKYDTRFHWKNYKYQFRNGPKEEHSASYKAGAGGVCDICGAVNSGKCVHTDWTESYKYKDSSQHYVFCNGCGVITRNEDHKFNGQGVCTRCGIKQGESEVEFREWVFYIATKEYYVEDDKTTSIPITELVNGKTDLKNFVWTTSTTGEKKFDSSKGEVSNDGTIIFGYSNMSFYAKLTDSNRKKLSDVVEVEITAYNKHGQLSVQRIKLIKNGPPRSSCKIYLNKTKYSLEDTEMKIKVRTIYDDFDDNTVKTYGKENMPWYEVNKNDIKVTSKDTSVLEITGEPTISELYDENGYWITVPISVKKVGIATISTNLNIEYTYNRHQTLKNPRTYTDVVSVVNKQVESGGSSGGGSGGSSGGGSGGSSGGSSGGGSAGVFAAIGAGALLLLLAVIGASMSNRR